MSARVECDGGCGRAFPSDWAEQCEWWQMSRADRIEWDIHLCPKCMARHFEIGNGSIIDKTVTK